MIDFALGFLTALVLQYVISKIYVRALEKRLETKIAETLTKLKETIIPARIEVANGVFYMYNRETNEFLAQGNTFDELEKTARSKFPNKLFNVPQSELNEIEKG
jgi:hypothetical protein